MCLLQHLLSVALLFDHRVCCLFHRTPLLFGRGVCLCSVFSCSRLCLSVTGLRFGDLRCIPGTGGVQL